MNIIQAQYLYGLKRNYEINYGENILTKIKSQYKQIKDFFAPKPKNNYMKTIDDAIARNNKLIESLENYSNEKRHSKSVHAFAELEARGKYMEEVEQKRKRRRENEDE